MNSPSQNAGFCDVRSPLQGPKGTGGGASLFRPSRGANDGFVSQPSHAHQENAAIAAGSIGPVLAPGTVTGLCAIPDLHFQKLRLTANRGKLSCFDGPTVLERSSRRIRGFRRNGVWPLLQRHFGRLGRCNSREVSKLDAIRAGNSGWNVRPDQRHEPLATVQPRNGDV